MEHVGFKALELYDQGRYFTMTGNVFEDRSTIRQADLFGLKIPTAVGHSSQPINRIPTPEEGYLIKRIKDEKDGLLFSALHDHGDLSRYNHDHSKADLAYIGIIAKWTNFDQKLTDSIYRKSALMRPKWDEVHRSDGTTYGDMTICKVLDDKRIYNARENEGYLAYKYVFRYNIVTGRTEVKVDSQWHAIDDYTFNSIHREMQNKGSKITDKKLHSLLLSDFVEIYHPFRRYFENLPPWDGKPWIKMLAAEVKTSDDEYWEFTLRKWLVAMVAGATIDKVVNQTVLLFMGKQGLGKSMFFRTLIPKKLNKYLTDTPPVPGSKDSDIQLAEALLILMDEFADMMKYQNAAKKEMITKSEIRLRRPFGRFSDKMVRHASLCGSANETGILNDPTGSRRYLIHKVESINYSHEIDMDMVFSEAYHLLNEGFQYWFDLDEIKRVHSHNRQFEDQSMEEELILKYFEAVNPNDPLATKYTSSEIVEMLHKKTGFPNSHSSKVKVGHALTKHKFQSTRAKGLTRWAVRKISNFESIFCQDEKNG